MLYAKFVEFGYAVSKKKQKQIAKNVYLLRSTRKWTDGTVTILGLIIKGLTMEVRPVVTKKQT